MTAPGTTREQLIERIVREVLRQIASSGPAPPAPAPATLRLDEAVVSVGGLEGRLEGVERIDVARRAVVTPAARDLLRQRGVGIVRRSEWGGKLAPAPLLFAAAQTTCKPAALLAAIERDGLSSERLAETGLASVTEEMAEEIGKGGRRGVLLTEWAPVAVCLANRRPGVRAIEARSMADWQRAAESLRPNLLVIDPRVVSLAVQRRLAAALARAATIACPENWKPWLA